MTRHNAAVAAIQNTHTDRAIAISRDARRMMVQTEAELCDAMARRFDATNPVFRCAARNEVRLCCRALRRWKRAYHRAFVALAYDVQVAS